MNTFSPPWNKYAGVRIEKKMLHASLVNYHYILSLSLISYIIFNGKGLIEFSSIWFAASCSGFICELYEFDKSYYSWFNFSSLV